MENSTPNTIDRISHLPDDILCRILSFLPIKLAFTTTVLSKRWSPLYKFLTSLSFDDESVPDEDTFLRFCRFVDTVTLSTYLIKTLHLNCSSPNWKRFNLDLWIGTAKRHPLENFHLVGTWRSIPLRPSIFRFPSLVVLKLKTLKIVGNITVDLPLLKILHLDRVYLKNKTNFDKILYGCPVLEDLIANIYYKEPTPEPDEVFTLGKATATGEFKILPKLIRVQINADEVPFRAIHNVEFLALTMRSRLPDPEINSYNTRSPIFRNLILLQLCMYNFHHWDHVMEVLQHCPKLQVLRINKLAPGNINWKYPNFVPECISSQLRSCTINYEGREDELRFTKYILQNAQLLGVMKINISHTSNPKPNRRILKEELSSFPRISRKCKLSVSGRT